jgi:hypothetical protein
VRLFAGDEAAAALASDATRRGAIRYGMTQAHE